MSEKTLQQTDEIGALYGGNESLAEPLISQLVHLLSTLALQYELSGLGSPGQEFQIGLIDTGMPGHWRKY
jgi:hypothetical protein